jgi:hypothetical protein
VPSPNAERNSLLPNKPAAQKPSPKSPVPYGPRLTCLSTRKLSRVEHHKTFRSEPLGDANSDRIRDWLFELPFKSKFQPRQAQARNSMDSKMTRGENPYSNSIVDLQGTANKTQPSKNLQLAIFNSVLRAILWLGLVVVGFIFVLPNFSVMFEEFGIELPHVTRFFFMLSDLAIRWMFIVLPAALLLFLGVEFAFLKSEKSRLRTILGVLWWLALLLSIGLVVVSVMSPLIAISSGLAQTR